MRMLGAVTAAALGIVIMAPAVAGAQGSPVDLAIRFHQQRAAQDPDDFLTYNRLAAAYIEKARETGDLTYYDLAERAATRSLVLVPGHPAAATAIAIVRFAQHRFAEALAQARQVLTLDGSDLFPWTVIGDVHVELGDYAEAAAAYARLLALSGPRHPHSRLAALHFLRGDPTAAIEAMQRAVRAAAALPSREAVAWHHVQLGHLFFDVGDLARAERAYGDALATFPTYHAALAGLARVRAGQKRHADAVTLYEKAIGVIPLPEYAAALGDVLQAMGRPDDARRQHALVEYIGRLNALNQVVYNRELALFYADHDLKLDTALELARREADLRRDVYTWDVLAWALLKSGKPAEALTAMQQALRLGTRDARLYFHAGMIHLRLGQRDKAREFLERALATNPHFHVLHAETARRALEDLRAAAPTPGRHGG
jgi:tetratricopeptide (TPR) repeat protein